MDKRTFSCRSPLRAMGWSLSWVCLLALPTSAAGPQGAKVVRGKVQFTQTADTLLIKADNRSIIDFRSFDIPAGLTVSYLLPSPTSRVLSRVTGGAASQIDGALTCNGRLYLVNPAGLFFGASSTVSAAGLHAAAGNLSNRDFLRSLDRFTGVNGRVVNDGRLEAGSVNLIGRDVSNSGSIVAPGGAVTLTASGGQVLLGERDGHVLVATASPPGSGSGTSSAQGAAGPDNPLGAGDIYSLAVHAGGAIQARQIVLGGEGARVDVSGSLDARQAQGQGGDIRLAGREINLAGATLDASGLAGGGRVEIGSAGLVAGAPAASAVRIDAASSIRADATGKGDGGRIVVNSADATWVDGQLTARGGPAGGAGGFVETSGGWLGLTQAPDVSAPHGQAGTWLLDPHDIRIVQDYTPWPYKIVPDDTGAWIYTPSGDAPQVSELSISTIINGFKRAATVIVQTSPGGRGKGDIIWDLPVPLEVDLARLVSQTSPHEDNSPWRLILKAHRNIDMTLYGLDVTDNRENHPLDSFQLVLVPNSDHHDGGRIIYPKDDKVMRHEFRHVNGAASLADDIAVPPDVPTGTLKDVVVVNTVMTPAPVSTNLTTTVGLAGSASNDTEEAKKQAVLLKAAESGALDATKAVSVRRTSSGGEAVPPPIQIGDAIGWSWYYNWVLR